MNHLVNVVLLLIFSSVLSACSTPKVAHVKYQHNYNFSQFKKYSLYQRDHEFNEWQSVSDAIRNDIEFAIENALDEQGYIFSPIEEADVVVTYYLRDNTKKSLKRYNNGVNYCSYCLVHGVSGLRSERLDSEPGSIIVDLVDIKTKRSVWRSNYSLNIKEKDNSRELQKKFHAAITSMISQLSISQHTLDQGE